MKRIVQVVVFFGVIGLLPCGLFAQEETSGAASAQSDSGIQAETRAGRDAIAPRPGGQRAGRHCMGKMKPRAKACRQKKMAEMKERDRRLDEKLAAMNAAQGDEKLTAMAAVINELVSQRKEMRAGMKGMRCAMCGMRKEGKPRGADRKPCGMERRAGRMEGKPCGRACQSEGPRVRVLSEPGCKGGQGKSTIIIIQE